MTNPIQEVILRIERALPVDGWPPKDYSLKRVTALVGAWGGYFFFLSAAIKRPIMPMITSVY